MTTDATIDTRRAPRIGEAVILALFLFVMAIGIAVHEPWFDEAQSWLLARDASVPDLLTTYLRYEGHPPLWYLILKVPAAAGLPYKTINVVGAAIAAIGVILLLLNADVPLLIKALLPFTFFVAFQYTIVSRSYVMILPLLLGILTIHRRRRERLWLFVLLLALLCHVSLHGTSIAGALTLLYAYDLWRGGLPRGAELRKHLLAAAALLLNVALIAWILRPAPDIAIKAKLDFGFHFSRFVALTWHGLAVNIFGASSVPRAVLSVIGFLLLVVWFARRRTLGTFVVLVLSLLPISSVYFGIWHEGLFFLVIVFAILLTFQHVDDDPRSEGDRRYDKVMLGVVALIFLNSIAGTWRSYGFDINAPYSGSQAAAEFIKEHHIDRGRLFGAGFPCLAIEPYFEKNVFANYETYGQFSFWDWSTRTPWFYRPRIQLRIEDLRAWQGAQLAKKPEFILVSVKFVSDAEYARMATEAGYRQIAFFPGAQFWKDHIIEEESYRLFARGDLAK